MSNKKNKSNNQNDPNYRTNHGRENKFNQATAKVKLLTVEETFSANDNGNNKESSKIKDKKNGKTSINNIPQTKNKKVGNESTTSSHLDNGIEMEVEVVEPKVDCNKDSADEWQKDYLDSSSTDQVDQLPTKAEANQVTSTTNEHYQREVDNDSESKYVDYGYSSEGS